MDNEFQSPNDVGAQKSFNSVIEKKKRRFKGRRFKEISKIILTLCYFFLMG